MQKIAETETGLLQLWYTAYQVAALLGNLLTVIDDQAAELLRSLIGVDKLWKPLTSTVFS